MRLRYRLDINIHRKEGHNSVKVYLEQGRYGKMLKEYKAVAVGLVDGDLIIL